MSTRPNVNEHPIGTRVVLIYSGTHMLRVGAEGVIAGPYDLRPTLNPSNPDTCPVKLVWCYEIDFPGYPTPDGSCLWFVPHPDVIPLLDGDVTEQTERAADMVTA